MATHPPEPTEYEPKARPALQFSLTALFVLLTVFALILSAFFGIGRLVGMSAMEVLAMGVGQFLTIVPTLIVWVIGLTMSLRRLRTNRKPAILTAVALSGLIVTAFVLRTAQIALIGGLQSGQIDSGVLSWAFAVIGLGSVIVNTGCWILILIAIFTGRPADPRPLIAQTDSRDPFADDEPITASIEEGEGASAP